MKIALAMIVKGDNAEALLLDRALDSVAPFVDGIFVTRTHKKGEKPNPPVGNVASKYNAHLSDFEWVDDFAKARNYNFSQVPKDYDYILWMDADDIYGGLEKLRPTLEDNRAVDAFAMWYFYDWDEFNMPIVVHRKTMMVKNDGCTRWVGAIHEDLEETRQLNVQFLEGINRIHRSNTERYKENAKRNLLIASKQVDVLPEDPRTMWNLANSQIGVGALEAAQESFKDFLASTHSHEEAYLAHMRLADVYKAQDMREEAIREMHIAIGLKPMLPDAYLILAYYYFVFGDYEKAEQYSLQGLRKPPQILNMIVYNPRDYDYNPMMLLAKVYFEKNRPDLMLPLLIGCLRIYPNDERLKKIVKDCKKDKERLGKALILVKKLQRIKDKKRLKKELAKIPDDIKSHPALSVIRNVNFQKETSSGKDLVIYCGQTTFLWNPELFKTKGFGGSEEAVVHLAREWAKMGWNVTVYNNCGHKEVVEYIKTGDGTPQELITQRTVTYKPYWEFNPRDKQDIAIIWRWPKAVDANINAAKIFIDLHDVISSGEFNENRLQKITKVMVKTHFHRSLFTTVPNEKICVIPNGLEIYKDLSIKKDPYLIINTSSPDRSMDVLPKLFKEVKKQVPKAKLQWAYGWEGFKAFNAHDIKKIAWMEETKKAIKDAGIEDLGRITQEEVGKLYQKASILAYPTEFAEIDCISVKKAQAARCLPIATDFGALDESIKFGVKIHSNKTTENWNRPYQFHFGLEDEVAQKEWVKMTVVVLKGEQSWSEVDSWASQFNWESIAARWAENFI